MKRLIFAWLTLLAGTTAWAQKEVRISINLKGLQKGDSLTLSWGATNRPLTPLIVQTDDTEEQTLRIPLNEPRLIIVGVKGHNGGYEILASPDENITVTGRVKKSKNGHHKIAEFQKMEIEGTAWNLPYQTLVADYFLHIDSLNSTIDSDFDEAKKIIQKAKSEKNEQAIADMYQTLMGQGYVNRMSKNYDDMKEYFRTLVMSQKSNFLAPLLMLRFGGNLDQSARPLYDALGDEAKQSYYGREVKNIVYPPSMIGNIAPTVAVMNTDGTEKLLSFNHTTNRYLLLDFWASWCEPCLNEVPNLKRIYEKYHSKGLDIIGLSVDRDISLWKETLKEVDEPWCNYIDIDRQAIVEYQVQYIPSIFIMDHTGKVIAEKLRGKDLAEFIEKLFDNK